jgi:hypothetical protein
VNPGRAITPIVLVVVAAAAAAYAYVFDRARVSDADRAGRRHDVFPSFRVEDVRRIELTRDGTTLALVRDEAGAAWTMTSPVYERADASSVDVLLRELQMATRVRDVSRDDAAGLDAPRLTGRVQVGPIEYRIALGADAPRPEGAAYMCVDDEGSFVVGRALKVQLLRGADAYRERSIVPYGASEVARIESAGQGAGFVLARAGDSFRVGGVDGLRASRAGADRVLMALGDLRAEVFVDDAAAERATAAPARVVTIAPRDAGRPLVRLVVGGPCPRQEQDVVVVRTAPARVAACVPRAAVEALQTAEGSLVDRALVFARSDEIAELRLEPVARDDARVDVARRGTGWHERSPEERDLSDEESESANSLAAALAEAEAIEARKAAPGERVPVRSRVTIVRAGTGQAEVIEVGGVEDGVARARRVDDGAVLRLAPEVARRFEPHAVALRAPGVWRASIDPADVVAIDDGCSAPPQRLELREGTWLLRTPAGFAADPRAAADLAVAIARARADAWIAESDDGSFGLAADRSCTVSATLEAGDAGPGQRVGLVIGAAGDGGVYARTLDAPAVLVAPTSLLALLAHPAIDRSRLRIDPAALGAVTLDRAGARLVLVRSGDHLARGGDGDSDASSSDARIEEALGGVRARFAVHTGPPAHDEGFERPTLVIDAALRADGGASVTTHVAVGAPTRVDGSDAYFARVAGVDATYAVPRAPVDAILDAW